MKSPRRLGGEVKCIHQDQREIQMETKSCNREIWDILPIHVYVSFVFGEQILLMYTVHCWSEQKVQYL
ncbi:hypothetical protein E2C01_088164 [Portunus trituberculatus]|uniref:Uncharacterized protein n=1 Tax=Portunus trituberculatus TaxID=210409 RepID=A0A5B7JJ54_PORTR|nr:hypothetical protein [Portunus trituberculatus]